MSKTRGTTTVGVALILASLGVGLGLLPQQQPLQATAAVQKTDQERVVGTWRFTKGRAGGKDLPEEFLVLSRLTFTKDGKVTFAMFDKEQQGNFKLPKAGQIDMPLGMGPPSPGIYKF